MVTEQTCRQTVAQIQHEAWVADMKRHIERTRRQTFHLLIATAVLIGVEMFAMGVTVGVLVERSWAKHHTPTAQQVVQGEGASE